MQPIRKVSIFDGKIAFQLGSKILGSEVFEITLAMIKEIPMVNVYLKQDNYINLWKSIPLQFCSLEYDLEWTDSL